MDPHLQSLKTPSKIALAALGLLFIGATIFYKERLFADTSFIAFNVINYQDFYIQNQRFGSFITQIVPFLGQKLHLPLKLVLFAYSISFNLFFLSVSLLIVFRYRQFALAILMALFYLLLVSDSYFLENDELLQGIAWMFLFFAVIFYLGGKSTHFIIILIPFSILSFLALSSHFITTIPFVFLWFYFIVEKKNWPFSRSKSIILSLLLTSIFAVKLLISLSQPYENEHLHGVNHFSVNDVIHSFSKPVVKMFLYRCVVNYWWAIIVLLLGLKQLFKNGEILLAMWTLTFCVGYLALMGLTYATEDSTTLLCHIELEWQSLAIIVATPFVFAFLPTQKKSVIAGLLVIIFMTRLAYIGTAIPKFNWHMRFREEVVAQMKKKGINKLALTAGKDLRTKCILDWAFPYETILGSEMSGDKPALTFFLFNPDDKRVGELIKDPKGFYNGFDLMHPNDLNSRYFSVDTTRTYQIMSYEDLFK